MTPGETSLSNFPSWDTAGIYVPGLKRANAGVLPGPPSQYYTNPTEGPRGLIDAISSSSFRFPGASDSVLSTDCTATSRWFAPQVFVFYLYPERHRDTVGLEAGAELIRNSAFPF